MHIYYRITNVDETCSENKALEPGTDVLKLVRFKKLLFIMN